MPFVFLETKGQTCPPFSITNTIGISCPEGCVYVWGGGVDIPRAIVTGPSHFFIFFFFFFAFSSLYPDTYFGSFPHNNSLMRVKYIAGTDREAIGRNQFIAHNVGNEK